MTYSGLHPTEQWVSLSLVVLTYNEETNLAGCLESLKGLDCEIFVVDSGSTDRSCEIARQYGAALVTNRFETHAKQWNWALQNLPVSTEWILGLDADQRLTPELRDEIGKVIDDTARKNIKGFYIRRRQIFRGRWIKHGGYYPKYLLKLFRRDQVRVDEADLVDHHFRVNGKTAKLHNDIIEDNQNELDLSVWIEKHNRYAVLQAREEMNRARAGNDPSARGSFWGSPDERSLWRKRSWGRLPLYTRPFLYFAYRYFFRLGFLDGKQGFIFHFLQAFWYRLLVDIELDELRRKQAAGIEQDLVRSVPKQVKERSSGSTGSCI